MVIAFDNLVTFEVGALWAIEDEIRSDGKLCKTFTAQVQRRQFWALCQPMAGFCSTDPMTGINPDPKGPIATNVFDEPPLYDVVTE